MRTAPVLWAVTNYVASYYYLARLQALAMPSRIDIRLHASSYTAHSDFFLLISLFLSVFPLFFFFFLPFLFLNFFVAVVAVAYASAVAVVHFTVCRPFGKAISSAQNKEKVLLVTIDAFASNGYKSYIK